MNLDDEISHLQKENNHSDSQLHRLKSDVAGMEVDAASDDKVTLRWADTTANIPTFIVLGECWD